MPSRICCPNNHSTKGISIHEAAVAISEGRALGVCKKCGKELQYRIDHTYTNDPSGKEFSFVVTRAVRLGTQLDLYHTQIDFPAPADLAQIEAECECGLRVLAERLQRLGT